MTGATGARGRSDEDAGLGQASHPQAGDRVRAGSRLTAPRARLSPSASRSCGVLLGAGRCHGPRGARAAERHRSPDSAEYDCLRRGGPDVEPDEQCAGHLTVPIL